ncbi:hypothetical protein Ari01nite_72860 [Paractinoplanes rishiriensis]|uniref:Uncharacterized protein n=1 Tax=Paractinoplanes rishiriensis TaxID=1050105 RepID=A0A919KAS2_9ACTN|nr:hypothetical protein Ari01nite_72860 [Actinoplanes rishiriensis]
MAKSQTPNPRRRRITDRGPATAPAETGTPARRRRNAGDRRTAIDARTQQAAEDSPPSTVIVHPSDFRLPNVLRHIEAGKIVLVISQHSSPEHSV